MGVGCIGLPNIRRMVDTETIKIGKYAKRMTSYYVFRKKIEKVFDFDDYLINNYDSIVNLKEKNELIKFYILDYDWIRNWKINSGYNNIKANLDSIYSNSNPDIIKDLQTQCQIFKNENGVGNVENKLNDSSVSYNIFISNNKYKLEDFDCLVDEESYILFKKMSFLNNFNKEFILYGIITKRIIILFISQIQTIKIIFPGKNFDNDREIIQLNINCLEIDETSGDFLMDISRLKFEEFKNYLLNKKDKDLLDILEKEGIYLQPEIILPVDKFQIKIRNENLFSKHQSKIHVPVKIIHFENINNFRKIGLENVGATCYMNATLQCFMNINSLTSYLLTKPIYEQIDSNNDLMGLSRAYCHLLEKVWLDETVQNYYAPKEFKEVLSLKNPLFQGINANDSKDLINFLLEVMNFELSRLNNTGNNNIKNIAMIDQSNMISVLENFRLNFTSNNNSIISQNFFFIMQTNTICSGCKMLKYNFQALFLIEFPLELVYNYSLNKNYPSLNSKGKKFVNILTCFEQYQLPNYFIGENQLYCNNCCQLKDANSENYFFSLPPVLVIILNRGKGKSFDCEVDFPEFLDLQNFVVYKKSIYNYQLKGVISHLGESGMSGHFIAYCRNRIDNQWYCYNDATVTLCNNQKSDFMVGTAYILFYESINNSNNTLFDNCIYPNYISNHINQMQMNIGINNNMINNCNNNNNNININNFHDNNNLINNNFDLNMINNNNFNEMNNNHNEINNNINGNNINFINMNMIDNNNVNVNQIINNNNFDNNNNPNFNMNNFDNNNNMFNNNFNNNMNNNFQ